MMKNIGEILKLGCIYLITIIAGTGLFLSLFWINFLNSGDILFFKSLIYLFTVCLLIIFILIFLKFKVSSLKSLTYRDILLITIIFFTTNHIFYGLIPFNASRSVSVMIVGYLFNHQDTLVSEKDMDTYIDELYFKKENAVQRRLLEQVEIGNVEKFEGGYKLTPKGIETVKLMGLITSVYNTDKNYAK
ncbi:hypothetical protein ICN48_02155 [Polynucleobacter sp. JS-Safj-400b-B2]|uniref:hypothetical protein n=1 Tax=Polynucleobacter sp. JS-Safj-400b-B2 TaxID=2576921 RepID=UPI001C0C8851|nr:hypothetical protein [Polynucleobacter sp. JS-Safj-400b-B2]MBU3625044.1 hypothetical protein [Polynucleobacter sp. JS-Safj-400b-B2]